MPTNDLSTQVMKELVALSGSVRVVESVLEYLSLALDHPPTTSEIVDEIMKRRNRALAAERMRTSSVEARP